MLELGDPWDSHPSTTTLAFLFTDEGPCSMKGTACFSTWPVDVDLYV